MSQESALTEARNLQASIQRHGAKCTIELTAGRAWAGDDWISTKHVIQNHHTAGSMNGLTPSYALCRNGRAGLPGPLCNGYGGRDFVYRIITMGLANHPGQGGPLNVAGFTIPKDSARPCVWGTEWEHNGTSPWPPAMIEFMARANAGILEWGGGTGHPLPVGRSIEHSTWATPAGRKIDRNGYTAARGQAEIRQFLSAAPAAPPGGFLVALSDQQQEQLFNAVMQLEPTGHQSRAADQNAEGQWVRHGGKDTTIGFVLNTSADVYHLVHRALPTLTGQVAGLTAALASLAAQMPQVDQAVVQAAVTDAVEKALEGFKLTLGPQG